MKRTAYIWDNIVQATRELGVMLNEGYEIVSSQIYESKISEEESEIVFAAVLVKECH